jgi:hypothetical protein
MGKAHRRGKGLIDSHPRLREWAEELLTLSRENPNIGPAYIYEVLCALSKKHRLLLYAPLTYHHVRGWWNTRTRQ